MKKKKIDELFIDRSSREGLNLKWMLHFKALGLIFMSLIWFTSLTAAQKSHKQQQCCHFQEIRDDTDCQGATIPVLIILIHSEM